MLQVTTQIQIVFVHVLQNIKMHLGTDEIAIYSETDYRSVYRTS
uniref:Polycystin2like [Hydra vulgaris] n=2 Tax=Lepeophtheirus salmonis TaxID=72036 RepID=A0A0K2UTA7_LEPSM